MQPGTRTAFLFPGNDIDCKEMLKKTSAEEPFRENFRKVNELARRLNLTESNADKSNTNKSNADYSNADNSNTDNSNADNSNADNVDGNFGPAGPELYNQMLTYAICCSICDLYKKQNIFPAMVSGYSLGIYSSLYAAEVFSFETGLSIIGEVFHLVRQFYESSGRRIMMGAIIGLTEQEIRDLLFKKVSGSLEIACLNGRRSFVIVGESRAIKDGLDLAQRLGAMRAVRINTEFGYHTSLLKESSEKLYAFLDHCTICEPQCKILSPRDLSLVSKSAIPCEIVKSLYSPVHWESLVNAMINIYDIREGYEVGPGESLAKMARYINQNFKVYPVYTVGSGLEL